MAAGGKNHGLPRDASATKAGVAPPGSSGARPVRISSGRRAREQRRLLRKAERLKDNPNQPLKLLISGAPGIGKTSLVNLIARPLTSHPAAIEEVSGWLGFASRRRFV